MEFNSYEDLWQGTKDTSDSIDVIRDDTMDWMKDFMYDPAQVEDLYSDQINKLLADDSEYMINAKESSRKAAEQSGMLQSNFMEGVGEAAAIDEVGSVAQQNVYTDVYNTLQENSAMAEEYMAAWIEASQSQNQKGKLLYDEWSSSLDEEAIRQQQKWNDYYLSELDEKESEYLSQYGEEDAERLSKIFEQSRQKREWESAYKTSIEEQYEDFWDEYTSLQASYNSDYNAQLSEYNQALADDKMQHTEVWGLLKATISEAEMASRNYLIAQANYLDEVTKIQWMAEDEQYKIDRMAALTKSMNELNKTFGDGGTKIGDNYWDYSFSFPDLEYSEPGVWGEEAGLISWSNMKQLILDIDDKLHNDPEFEDIYRDLDVYKFLEYIRGERVGFDGETVGGFEQYQEDYPVAGKAITRWFSRVGAETIEDEVEDTLATWVLLMRHLDYMDQPESEQDNYLIQKAYSNPSGVPSTLSGLGKVTKYSLAPSTSEVEIEELYIFGNELMTREEVTYMETQRCQSGGSCEYTDWEEEDARDYKQEAIDAQEAHDANI